MIREDIFEVLQVVGLYLDGKTLSELKESGFDTELTLIAIRLCKTLQEVKK